MVRPTHVEPQGCSPALDHPDWSGLTGKPEKREMEGSLLTNARKQAIVSEMGPEITRLRSGSSLTAVHP